MRTTDVGDTQVIIIHFMHIAKSHGVQIIIILRITK